MTRQLTPEERGIRDGRDAALLCRNKKNPYQFKSDEWLDYELGWKQGYDEEWELLNH